MVRGNDRVKRVRPDIKPLPGESFREFASRRQRILQAERTAKSLFERQRAQRAKSREELFKEQRRIARGKAAGLFEPKERVAEVTITAGAPSEVEVGGKRTQVIPLPGGGLGAEVEGEIVRISPETVQEVTPPTMVERAKARLGVIERKVETAIGRQRTVEAIEREAEFQELKVQQLRREGKPVRAKIQEVSALVTRGQLGAERAIGVKEVAAGAAVFAGVGLAAMGGALATRAIPSIAARVAPRAPAVATGITTIGARGLVTTGAVARSAGLGLTAISAKQFTERVSAAPTSAAKAEQIGIGVGALTGFALGGIAAKSIVGPKVIRPPVTKRVKAIVQPKIRVSGVARVERVSPLVSKVESKLIGNVEGEPFLSIAKAKVTPPKGRVTPFRAIGLRFKETGFGRAVTRVGTGKPELTRFQALQPTLKRFRRAGIGVVRSVDEPIVTVGRTVTAKKPIFRLKTPRAEVKVREAAFRALGIERFAKKPRLRARPIEGPFRLIEIEKFPTDGVPKASRAPRRPTTVQKQAQREAQQLAAIQATQVKEVTKQFRAPKLKEEARLATKAAAKLGVPTAVTKQRIKEVKVTQQIKGASPKRLRKVTQAAAAAVTRKREVKQRQIAAVSQRFVQDQERRLQQAVTPRQAQIVRQRQRIVARSRAVTTVAPPTLITTTLVPRVTPPPSPVIFKLPKMKRAPVFKLKREDVGTIGKGVRTPSLTAIARDIKAKRQKEKKAFTGLELRPVISK